MCFAPIATQRFIAVEESFRYLWVRIPPDSLVEESCFLGETYEDTSHLQKWEGASSVENSPNPTWADKTVGSYRRKSPIAAQTAAENFQVEYVGASQDFGEDQNLARSTRNG